MNWKNHVDTIIIVITILGASWSMNDRIDRVEDKLSLKIETGDTTLSTEIKAVDNSLSARIGRLEVTLARMDERMKLYHGGHQVANTGEGQPANPTP